MSDGRIGNSNQNLQISGVVSAPAYSFASDNDSGMYRVGANILGLAANNATVLTVDGSTASSATGVQIKSAAAAAGVALSVTSSGTNENLTIDAKGSGTITLNGTATGNIFIPRETLTIGSGSAATDGQVYLNGGTNSGKGAGVVFQLGSVNKGWIGTDGWSTGASSNSDMAYWAQSSLGHKWYTNASTTIKMELTSAGVLDLPIGQIKFPATQNPSSDANVLDDWEEGTWSPALKFGGASVGMTYSGQTGFYQKMGKLVVCWLEIQLSAKGSSTGSATLTGFPFTAANNGDYPAFNSTANSVTGDILKGYLTPNTAIADLTSNVANSTAATDTIFSNTTKLQIQVIYNATT